MSLNEETIRAAVYSGSIDLFATLLSKDPTIINYQFDRRGTPLALACQSQQPVNFLEFLLKQGADPNQDPDVAPFPLASVAAFYSDTSAAALLLEHGAKLEIRERLQPLQEEGTKLWCDIYLSMVRSRIRTL